MNHHLQRARDSMDALLNLKELPDLSCDSAVLETLHTLRSIPMPEEREVIWAIQNEDDVATRQQLPAWISQQVCRKVTTWADENAKWMERISKRLDTGRSLTPSMEKTFETWQKNSKEQKLLFNKSKQTLVTRLRANVDMAKLEQTHFSLNILMSDDPSQLCVKVGNGDTRRLVLLQGKPVEGTDDMPICLDQGIAVDGLPDFAADDHEDNVDDLEENQFQHECDLAEQEALEQDCMMDQEQADDDGNELWEIMIDTDEEDDLKTQAWSLCSKHTLRMCTYEQRCLSLFVHIYVYIVIYYTLFS